MGNSLEYQRRWRRDNPTKVAAATQRYRAAHPDGYRARQRRHWKAKRRFVVRGVTAEWYRDQLVGQAGRCAICSTVFDSDKNTHIDHDHETGRIRALLCSRCNLMLGIAQDSTGVLTSAIVYLEAFSREATRTEGDT